MKEMFLNFCGFSLITSVAIVLAIALRPLLKKGPSFVRCIIWALLFLRLMLPFTIIEAPYSSPVSESVTAWREELTVSTPAERLPSSPIVDRPITDKPVDSVTPPVVDKAPADDTSNESPVAAEKKTDYLKVISVIWASVGVGLFGYMLISNLRLRYKVRDAVVYDSRVRIIGLDCSPFVMGIINPNIYIPATIDQSEWRHIIAHETSHIKRLDHILKPLAFAVLCLHWFNPLVWAAYILLSKDIEYACDERTVKAMAGEEKRAYSLALLSVSRSTPRVFAPLSFGKVNVKERIKRVMGYRNSRWALCLALTVCVTLTALVACTPSSDKPVESSDDVTSEESADTTSEESAVSSEDVISEEESSTATPAEPETRVGYVTADKIPEIAFFYDDVDKTLKEEYIEIRFSEKVRDFRFISVAYDDTAPYAGETLWEVDVIPAGNPFYANTYIWEGLSDRGVSYKTEDGHTVYARISFNPIDGGLCLDSISGVSNASVAKSFLTALNAGEKSEYKPLMTEELKGGFEYGTEGVAVDFGSYYGKLKVDTFKNFYAVGRTYSVSHYKYTQYTPYLGTIEIRNVKGAYEEKVFSFIMVDTVDGGCLVGDFRLSAKEREFPYRSNGNGFDTFKPFITEEELEKACTTATDFIVALSMGDDKKAKGYHEGIWDSEEYMLGTTYMYDSHIYHRFKNMTREDENKKGILLDTYLDSFGHHHINGNDYLGYFGDWYVLDVNIYNNGSCTIMNMGIDE